MQVTPHVHGIEIGRQWKYSESGYFYIKYGDTRVRAPLARIPRWRMWALKRAIRIAIQRHDHGSQAAGRAEARRRELMHLTYDLDPQRWGSEQLAQR